MCTHYIHVEKQDYMQQLTLLRNNYALKDYN